MYSGNKVNPIIIGQREAEKLRKLQIKFKKECKQNYTRKKARNKSDVNKEGVTYQSSIALTLDPQLLQDGTLQRKTWLLLLRANATTVLYAYTKYQIFFEISDI